MAIDGNTVSLHPFYVYLFVTRWNWMVNRLVLTFHVFLYAIKKTLLCHIFIVMYHDDYMYFVIK